MAAAGADLREGVAAQVSGHPVMLVQVQGDGFGYGQRGTLQQDSYELSWHVFLHRTLLLVRAAVGSRWSGGGGVV